MVSNVKVFGDLLILEPYFLMLLDVNIRYTDVYVIHTSEIIVDKWYSDEAWFVDEFCMIYESINNLEIIGSYIGLDVSFWEDNDLDED